MYSYYSYTDDNMVDIVCWRAAIGLWALTKANFKKTNSGCNHCQNKLIHHSIAIMCLVCLLLIGGIEMNPGPISFLAFLT